MQEQRKVLYDLGLGSTTEWFGRIRGLRNYVINFTYIVFNPHNNPREASLIIPILLRQKLSNLFIITELINCVGRFEDRV